MKSITMRAERNSGQGKIVLARMTAPPGSAEQKAARKQIDKLDQLKKKRGPDERHKLRMSALYVDVTSDGQWSRPKEAISAMRAHDFITDAANDYSLQQDQRYTNLEFVKAGDPQLHDALQKWSDRPQLPAAEWPLWPPEPGTTPRAQPRAFRKILAAAEALWHSPSQTSRSYAYRLLAWTRGRIARLGTG
jgi:hypothetical protein